MKNKEYLDTIVAPITSSTGSSVAMIRISGKKAISIADRLFPAKELKTYPGGRFFYGILVNNREELIDEVILMLYKAPHSFSGEDTVEISLHANPIIVEKAIQAFLDAGCRLAGPGEFSKRAYLNGKLDLLQAEAIANLIKAKSDAAVNNALYQVSGRFSSEIKDIKEKIIEVISLLEIDIDFSDQDLEIISPGKVVEKINYILDKINRLVRSYKKGRTLTEGMKVLITGKPNVGKSSLMNALVNKERVIVSSTPGTTRDIVYEDIYLDQILIRFIDSAGIHLTNNAVESEGIEKTRQYFDIADIVILVVDVSRELSKDDTNLFELILQFYSDKLVVGANKVDLGQNETTKGTLISSGRPVVFLSAKTGKGVSDLKNILSNKTKQQDCNIAEESFVINQRQVELLKKTENALSSARRGLINNIGNEFVAFDMREGVDALSEITGEISTEDILNTIFADFCIGK